MPSFSTPIPARPLATDSFGEPRSFSPLGMTSRQMECLFWVQEGKSATDIGAILGISRRTVEWHLMSACTLLGVRTRVQAVIKARDLGMLGAAPPA